MTTDIKGRMARGAVWMVALRLSVTLLGFVSTIVLARLLLPADFGLVALGTAMVAAIDLLTSFRFDVALIQNQAAGRDEYDTAWTLNQLLGLALALLLCVAAYPAALFYGEPRLAPIVFALAIGAVLDGLQNIGVVNFRRNLDFGREFIFTVSKKVVQVVVAAALAWEFRSYWALAAGILASSVTGVIASYAMEPYRPRWSLARAAELFHFSKWLVVDNVIFFMRHRSPSVIIGRFAGPTAVGLFTLAYELATLAHNNLTAPIDRAMFPGYSRMAQDRELLKSSYLSVAGMTALVALPVAVGTASVAPMLVPILFGDAWLGAIPVVQVLCLGSSIAMLGGGTTAVYLGLGKPRLLVWLGATHVAIMLTVMALLLPKLGLVGAAWAYVAASSVVLPLQLGILQQVLRMSPMLWVKRIWRPVVAVLTMHFCVVELQIALEVPQTTGARILDLLFVILCGVVGYVGAALVLWLVAGRPNGPEQYLLNAVRSRLGGPPPAVRP
jgi:lipopolysaccharide exporter